MPIYRSSTFLSSHQSLPIAVYSSQPLDKLKAQYLFIGGVHGDEPEGVFLAINLLLWLQHNNLQKSQWALIACLNPDGYYANSRINAQAIDLNRNFPSSDWTPDFEAPRYYPGKKPCSSPEVYGLVNLIKMIKPKLIMHFHSWKPGIVYTSKQAPNEAIILSKNLNFDLQSTIGYDTPGSLGQYAWFNLKIPVICIEEPEHRNTIDSWPLFEAAFKEIIRGC